MTRLPLLRLALCIPALFGCSDRAVAWATAGQTAAGKAFEQRLEAAKGGDTIRLQPGDYGEVTFPRRTFSPALKIEAGRASFTTVTVREVDGLTWKGGSFTGQGGRTWAFIVREARNIRVEDVDFGAGHRGGLVFDRSSDSQAVNNRFRGLQSEGIDIALSRRILIQGNSCRDFNPTPAVYGPDGKRITDGDHPDCIQAWSRPTAPPTSDIKVIGNYAEGKMQGIFFGNHIRDGVDDGGFDRIEIRDNRVMVAYPNGVRLDDGRDSVVTGNEVLTVPGATLPSTNRPVRAMLSVKGTSIVACGNTIGALIPAHRSRFPVVAPCGTQAGKTLSRPAARR